MDFDSVFKKDNISLVFSTYDEHGTFIAKTGEYYSGLMQPGDFGRDWAWRFPAGRYVIVILQRHSVFADGKQVYLNDRYTDSVGNDSRYKKPVFVLITDEEREYTIPSWNRELTTHTIQNEDEPLQIKVYNLKDALKEAKSLSENDRKAAVLEWFEDYDMF